VHRKRSSRSTHREVLHVIVIYCLSHRSPRVVVNDSGTIRYSHTLRKILENWNTTTDRQGAAVTETEEEEAANEVRAHDLTTASEHGRRRHPKNGQEEALRCRSAT
jgi:hypothetical protein